MVVHLVSVVIGATLMAAGIGYLVASNLQLLELQSEVNAALPQADKFEPLFWSYFRIMQLRRLQRKLLPQNSRIEKSKRFAIIGFTILCTGLLLLLLGLEVLSKS
jgi:hypothetical protein